MSSNVEIESTGWSEERPISARSDLQGNNSVPFMNERKKRTIKKIDF